MLFASLVDDPDSDPEFDFDEDIAASKRAKLFNLIEELVLWENSKNPRVINAARAEIARCIASRKTELKELKPDDKFGSTTIFHIKGMLATDLFLAGLATAFSQMRAAQIEDVPLTIYYAVKQTESEDEAVFTRYAKVMETVGSPMSVRTAETARDLAYRLYTIAERKKWADEGLAYNGLVIAWPELSKLALAERTRARDTQGELFS